MRQEIFRMERVTYTEQGIRKLENFNMQIYAGEVMGLIPVNAHGKNAVMKLLQHNLPIYDGYIYYSGELVNSWRGAARKSNRVSIKAGIQAVCAADVCLEKTAPALYAGYRDGYLGGRPDRKAVCL